MNQQELLALQAFQDAENTINKLIDDTFKVHYLSEKGKIKLDKNGNEIYYKVDVSFNGLNDASKLMMRWNVVQLLGGYHENNKLITTASVKASVSIQINELIEFIVNKSISDINLITEDLIFDWLLGFVEPDKCLAYGSIVIRQVTINNLINLSKNRQAFFPIHVAIRRELLKIKVKEKFKKTYPDRNVKKWLRGKSFETASLETAMLLIDYSYKKLTSPEFYTSKAWYQTVKEFHKNGETYFGLLRFGRQKISWKLMTQFYETGVIPDTVEYYRNPKVTIQTPPRELFIRFMSSWFNKTKELTNNCENKIDTIEKFHSVVNGWDGQKIKQITEEVNDNAIVIFSTLTGYRVSELESLSSSSLDKKSGVYYLTSNVRKNRAGMPVKRSSADAVAVALDACLSLSMLDKTKPLEINGELKYPHLLKEFSHHIWLIEPNKTAYDLKRDFSTLGSGAIRKAMKNVHEQALSTLPVDLRAEFEALEELVTPHAFRHAFVDFLLRRFDGDVISAVRRCFAHSSTDVLNFVINYYRNKVPKSVQQKAEKNYTIDLIKRMHSDYSKTHFSGNAVDYIRRELDKFQYQTIDEFDEQVEEWVSNKLVRLAPHSYGFCILFKERIALAKCRDTKADILKSQNGESEYCVGCPNLAVHIESHIDALRLIQNIHQAIIDDSNNPENILSLFKKAKESDIRFSETKVKAIDSLLSHPLEVKA
jgi:integrase